MAKDEKRSRIKVTPEEEEDIVIQAGIPALDSEDFLEEAEWEEAAQAEAMAASQDLLAQEEAGAESYAEAGLDYAEPSSAHLSDDASSAAHAEPASSGAGAKKKDDYQPTTLEDLQSSKMPMTQIVVIIVAIVAVIAFSVYWFGFHPSQTASDDQAAEQTPQTEVEAETEAQNWDSETS